MSFKALILNFVNNAQENQRQLIAGLNDNERDAIGTPDHWSAHDHVAHLTFWKQYLSRELAARAHFETLPEKGDSQIINPQVFEAHRRSEWSEILLEAEQTHAELVVHIEYFTYEDFHRDLQIPLKIREDGTSSEEQSLCGRILSHGFWHPLEHYTQYYLEHKKLQQATHIQQVWRDLVMQPEVPSNIRSIGLATIGGFYFTIEQKTLAQKSLRQAIALTPSFIKLFEEVPEIMEILED